MEILISGSYTYTQVYNAVLMVSRPTSWRLAWRYLVLMIFVGLLGLVIYNLFTQKDQLDSSFLTTLISLAIVAYVAINPFLQPRQTAKRLWTSGAMQQTLSGKITSEGIYLGVTTSPKLNPWRKYIRLRRTPDLIAMLTADSNLTILPRSFFASDTDWQEVNKLLDSQVKLAAKLD